MSGQSAGQRHQRQSAYRTHRCSGTCDSSASFRLEQTEDMWRSASCCVLRIRTKCKRLAGIETGAGPLSNLVCARGCTLPRKGTIDVSSKFRLIRGCATEIGEIWASAETANTTDKATSDPNRKTNQGRRTSIAIFDPCEWV
jgi:hypothetical protein